MDKKYAFLLALLITLLIAVNLSLFTGNVIKEREYAKISRIIDGDTLELEDGRKLRLLNINSPEKSSLHYKEAMNYLSPLLNKTIELETVDTDKYGRTLARIYIPEYLNFELVKQGLANKFLVEESELNEFSEAEESAINAEKGIWKHSSFYNCFSTYIDEKNEKITLINKCNKLNISNWILKDESRQQYEFKELQLAEITLHSNVGKDNETDIFWNSKTNIWNNDRDTLYLFDKEGNIAHFHSYGY